MQQEDYNDFQYRKNENLWHVIRTVQMRGTLQVTYSLRNMSENKKNFWFLRLRRKKGFSVSLFNFCFLRFSLLFLLRQELTSWKRVHELTIPNRSLPFLWKEDGLNFNTVRSSTFENILINCILM
jgi:hypothetical protein